MIQDELEEFAFDNRLVMRSLLQDKDGHTWHYAVTLRCPNGEMTEDWLADAGAAKPRIEDVLLGLAERSLRPARQYPTFEAYARANGIQQRDSGHTAAYDSIMQSAWALERLLGKRQVDRLLRITAAHSARATATPTGRV